MRKTSGGIIHLSARIVSDLEERETGLSKPQRIGLADLAATMLAAKSVNTSELATLLPRTCDHVEDRYRYINRWLLNKKIIPDSVMAGYYEGLFEQVLEMGHQVVLMIDQTQIGRGFECLMVSVRFGERAVPLAWRVAKTEGNIGFEVQAELLRKVFAILPPGLKIVLMGDRFYGTAKLILLLQEFGWGYRLRLKGNLNLYDQWGSVMTPLEACKLKESSLEGVRLGENGPEIGIGIIHEDGHPEPWFIAMDGRPTEAKTLDYGLRWGIGVSREGHISKLVKVQPRLKGSRPRSLGGIMARKQDGEALRQHLRKEDGQSFRL